MKPDQQPGNGVEVGDHIYFNHAKGAQSAPVIACGAHGVTVKHGKDPHKVRWDQVLGHKTRVQKHYDILEEGEDGLIVKDGTGKRRFLKVPPESRHDGIMLEKSGNRLVVFAKAGEDGARAGLAQDGDKWARNPAQAYGQHNISVGQNVEFEGGAGKVMSTGRDGAMVEDADGKQHPIVWGKITGRESDAKQVEKQE